jgi:hypothetical protein
MLLQKGFHSLSYIQPTRAPANPTLQSFFLILSVDKTTVNTAMQMEILQNLICRKQTNSSPRKFEEKINEKLEENTINRCFNHNVNFDDVFDRHSYSQG